MFTIAAYTGYCKTFVYGQPDYSLLIAVTLSVRLRFHTRCFTLSVFLAALFYQTDAGDDTPLREANFSGFRVTLYLLPAHNWSRPGFKDAKEWLQP